MVCPRCGTHLINGMRVCMACGHNVAYLTTPGATQTKPVSPAPSQTPTKLMFTAASAAKAQAPAPAKAVTPEPEKAPAKSAAPVKPVEPAPDKEPVKEKEPTPFSLFGSHTKEETPAPAPAPAKEKTPTPFSLFEPAKKEETPAPAKEKTPTPFSLFEPAKKEETPAPAPAPVPAPAPAPAPVKKPEPEPEPEPAPRILPNIDTARTEEDIKILAELKTGYNDKFIKKYANYWGHLATKLFDEESYEFVFGGVLNIDGNDDRIAGCGITQRRIIITTTQGTVSYPYERTKGVSSSKSLIGATVVIEIPKGKVKISVDKPYLENILKALDEAIKKYRA